MAQTNLKNQLYEFIHTNKPIDIKSVLQEWLSKINTLCTLSGMTDKNIHIFFPPVQHPEQVCGYVHLTKIETLHDMINDKSTFVNQRVLLTTIYRFSKIFARLLWCLIFEIKEDGIGIDRMNTDEDYDISTFIATTGHVLDKDELERHIKFVLQKHGIRDSEKDAFKALRRTFSSDMSFLRRNNGFPSIITSLTQPLGTDPVINWMLYQGDNAVRHINNRNIFSINESDLNLYYAGLCDLEKTLLTSRSSPLPWKTGTMLYTVNPQSDFFKLAEKYKKKIICGPSCTTQMMLDCASLFGIDVNIALLAIVPWMEIPQDHSLFEILLAANPYLPFHEYVLKENAATDQHEITFLTTLYNDLFQGSQQSGGKRVQITQKMKPNKTFKSKRSVKKMDGGDLPNTVLPNFSTKLQTPVKSEPSNYYYQPQPHSLLADTWHPDFDYSQIVIPKRIPNTSAQKQPQTTDHLPIDLTNITKEDLAPFVKDEPPSRFAEVTTIQAGGRQRQRAQSPKNKLKNGRRS